MKQCLIVFVLAIVVAVPVFGDTQSDETEQVVMQHLMASEAGDATQVPRHYAENAVVIFGNKATTGVEAIQRLFADLYARTDMHLTLKTTVFEGSVGYVVWAKNNLRGSDTFIVRDGKIVAQTGVVFGSPSEDVAETVP